MSGDTGKFEELVKSFVDLDDQIKQASKDIKVLKDKKKEHLSRWRNLEMLLQAIANDHDEQVSLHFDHGIDYATLALVRERRFNCAHHVYHAIFWEELRLF